MNKFIFIFTISLFLWSCAVNPVTGKKQITFMSEAQEIAMGQSSDPSVIAQFGLYDNEDMQTFIKEKGEKMAAISHRNNLDFEFRVLDSDVVNAFAVPGGYIYFTRGIMAHFNNEAQFAGVLGHEIGHITARHSAQQYTKQMLTQIAFIGGMVASEKFRDFAGEAMQGMQLLFLKFSRTDESQSDQLGVEYASTVGYDTYEMADFFKTLDRMSGGDDGRLPEFYSTHPDPGRRYQNVRALTDQWRTENGSTPSTINRDTYLNMIDGIVYGQDPRQGYVENNVFYHPELKFQFPVPLKWKHQNSPTQFQMAPEDGNSLMVFTLSQKKKLSEAAQEVKEMYELKNARERSLTISGMNAYAIVADYPQADPSSGESTDVAMQTVLIKDGDIIYLFHGLCKKEDFSRYEPHFDRTMLGYKKLRDPSKINVVPERLKLTQTSSATTLRQFLTNNRIATDRHKELAILNGMELNDQLSIGTSIKLVHKPQ